MNDTTDTSTEETAAPATKPKRVRAPKSPTEPTPALVDMFNEALNIGDVVSVASFEHDGYAITGHISSITAEHFRLVTYIYPQTIQIGRNDDRVRTVLVSKMPDEPADGAVVRTDKDNMIAVRVGDAWLIPGRHHPTSWLRIVREYGLDEIVSLVGCVPA